MKEIMTTYEENATTETYTTLTPPTSTSTIQDFTQKQSSDEEHMTIISVKNEDQTNEIVKKYLDKKPLDPIYDSCDNNPDFAIICSFISLFGDKIEIQISIEHLKTSIENQIDKIDDELVEIHVKLLKKIRKYFVRDLWEKAIVKFVAEYSYEDSCELDEVGYLKTRTSIKLQLLLSLLDAQFEFNQKFKETLNEVEADELRILPIGRDNRGNSYWKQIDNDGNFRMYQEDPIENKSWKTVFTKPEELNYLIDDLDRNAVNRNKKCRTQKKEKDEEFLSCEEKNSSQDDAIREPVITRRSRTAKSSPVKEEQEEVDSDTTIEEEDEPCFRCKKSDDPELILLCDMCDDGYHISCCIPPLILIPEGDWFCPNCEHKTLLIKLKEFYTSLMELLEAREKERLKKEKLSQARMKRVRKINHLFIPRESREPKVANPEEAAQLSSETDFDDEDDMSDMEVGNATSDESFQASSCSELDDEEEEDMTETEEDEDDDMTDMDSFDSSATSIDEIVAVARLKSKSKRKQKSKKVTRLDRYESDDDYQPTRRAAATKKVSYKESSDEDELIDHLFDRDDTQLDTDMEMRTENHHHHQDQCDNVVLTINERDECPGIHPNIIKAFKSDQDSTQLETENHHHHQDQSDNVVLTINDPAIRSDIIKALDVDLSTSPLHQPFYSESDYNP